MDLTHHIFPSPHFERAASALEPAVRLAKLNTDEHPKTSLRLRIRSIPTICAID